MATKQPNILILWGDDIGMWNISHFSRGMMGYPRRTSTASPKKASASPTITASRAAPLDARLSSTGQNPLRTGLTKVGMPGATVGLQAGRPDHRRNA